MVLYRIEDTLPNGMPYKYYDDAFKYVLEQYYKQCAYDALLTYFASWTPAVGPGTDYLGEFNSVLIANKDARRLKALWARVFSTLKTEFWALNAIWVRSKDPEVKPVRDKVKRITLETIAQVQRVMLELGETEFALKLNDDASRVEPPFSKKVPRITRITWSQYGRRATSPSSSGPLARART